MNISFPCHPGGCKPGYCCPCHVSLFKRGFKSSDEVCKSPKQDSGAGDTISAEGGGPGQG